MEKFCESLVMNNGYKIPRLGFGTFLIPPEEAEEACKAAIQVGYRHIDTAAYYENEYQVGKAIRDSGIKREEFFVTSKLWDSERGYDKTMAAFKATMKQLDIEYLDLYLIHWPANYLQFGDKAKELNAETWRAFEDLYKEGLIKAIGVSNFMQHHLEDLEKTATIKPMVNQLELHPGFWQAGVVKYCQDNGIIVEAWSPLARGAALGYEPLMKLAAKYNTSVSHLCLRWLDQHGILPLVKSVKASRMADNTKFYDFTISDEDILAIDAMEEVGGQCSRPDDVLW